MRVLTETEWRARQDQHRQRIRRWTDPHRARRRQGTAHPVHDFLFTYYSHRPSRLERWQPGFGVALEGGTEFLQRPGYRATAVGVALDPETLTESRMRTARFVHQLLTATASRPPQLGCFGLHEWAMLYRTRPDEMRHADWPLRLGHSGTDEVVESMRIRCTHHDAFRFFTGPARPLNTVQPRREDQTASEQPGCLHANMDLFKWAYKLDPFVESELVADCFELAARVRELDMRASPYDLSELGYTPVPIETPDGRAEYARQQRDFSEEAAELRHRLIETTHDLLTWGEDPVGS